MSSGEVRAREVARQQHALLTRRQALSAGMTPEMVDRRVRSGHWQQIHPGVDLIGIAPPTWEQRLLAACLSGGDRAVASYRAAALVWGVDGIESAPIEITVPHGEEAAAVGVLTHRSRRLGAGDVTRRNGIPVTTIERTLCDVGRFVPPVVVEMAVESAVRKWLTTTTKLGVYLDERGRGLPGARTLERFLRSRPDGRPTGSQAESRLVRFLRPLDIPDPVRQFELVLRDGQKITVDVAWPAHRFAIEWQGYDFHSGRRAFEEMLERRNAATEVGWELYQLSGGMLRRDGTRIAHRIRRAVGGIPVA